MNDSTDVKEATAKDLASSIDNSPSADFQPADVKENPRSEKANSGVNVPPVDKLKLMPKAGRGGGPRTDVGKERSRQNALKHGIFARAVVMEGEPRKQFDFLLQGLLKDFKPEGTLENLLVEKLASLVWRYRRTLVTERAEIRMGMRFNPLAAELRRHHKEEAVMLFGSMERPGPGLLLKFENPFIRERILQLLKTLKLTIQINGFNAQNDFWILKAIFGEGVQNTFASIYSVCDNPGNLAKEKGFEEFDLSPQGRKAKFLEILNQEIDRMEHLSEVCEGYSAMQRRLEEKCTGVPEPERLDRMLRYEASLERAFDRTLNQLERVQRMRRGQSIPPPINVNIS